MILFVLSLLLAMLCVACGQQTTDGSAGFIYTKLEDGDRFYLDQTD